MSELSVSIIVVSYGRTDSLERLLYQLQNVDSVELVVVDNNEDEGFIQSIRDRFSNVHFVRSGKNLGAAGGRNFGVQSSSGDICLFVDDDAAIMREDFVERTVGYFAKDDSLACLAFPVFTQEGEIDYEGIPRFDKKALKKNYQCSYFSANGCAIRKSVFNEAGQFWEKLFIDCEELDLSFRIIDRGYSMLYAWDIPLKNLREEKGREKGRRIFYYTRNRFLVALRNLPLRYATSTILMWWGKLFVESIAQRELMAFFRGVVGAFRLLPDAIRQRKCLSKDTLHYLRLHSGRLYY